MDSNADVGDSLEGRVHSSNCSNPNISLRLKPWAPSMALNHGILIYLLYTLHVPLRVTGIPLKGLAAHLRGHTSNLRISCTAGHAKASSLHPDRGQALQRPFEGHSLNSLRGVIGLLWGLLRGILRVQTIAHLRVIV